MKLRNKTQSVRILRDRQGQIKKIGPGETIEMDRPVFNDKVFEVVDDQKSKETKTLDVVKKEKLKKEAK